AQIYGIESVEDTSILVLELVEGETLATRIERGPLPIDDAVLFCSQIAAGLQAAHELGVVHRDLKPANVQITAEGVAKVLDFGVAKRPRPASDDSIAYKTMTEAGALVGTPGYMAPEQIRGKPTDRRADIWAFGCLLFEALTGKGAFKGATLPDLLAAIVDRQPDWSLLPAATPPAIRQLLRRCLDKNPRTRLQDIGEARITLETDPAAAESQASSQPRHGNQLLLFVAGAVVAAIATTFFTIEFDSTSQAGGLLDEARFTPLTNFEGREFDASISPDGSFVAFVSDRDGVYDALVGQVGTGIFENVTKGRVKVWLRTAVRDIGFNVDGTRIWIGAGSGRTMQSWPLIGSEPPQNIIAGDAVNVEWSHDGTRMVYHTDAAGDPMFIADRNGGSPRLLIVAAAGLHQHHPKWSFDDRWIYFSRGVHATGDMNLWRVRPDGSEGTQLTTDKVDVRYPSPIDERTVVYVAKEPSGAGPWLWAYDVESETSVRVAPGLQQYTSVAASADGRRLVATVASPRSSLWKIPIQQDVVRESAVERLEGVPTLRARAPSYGASGLFFLFSQGEGEGLRRFDGGQTTRIRIGDEDALLEPPAISPDGQSLAVVVRQGNRRSLNVVQVDGTGMRSVSDSLEVHGTPAWSRDGESIVTGGADAGGPPGLFAVRAADGELRRIAEGAVLDPICSPTEDLIVYSGPQVGATLPLLTIRSDGTPVEFEEIQRIQVFVGGQRVRFLPDGSGLVYMQGVGGQPQEFHLLDFASKQSRQLAALEGGSKIQTFDISLDGKSIVFDRLRENSDVILIDLTRSLAGR
ncbi:MAG: protein kinase domain-containing protein, partial [Planctomycetota bacterium]